MDVGGTSPWMGEGRTMQEQLSRAMPGAIAEHPLAHGLIVSTLLRLMSGFCLCNGHRQKEDMHTAISEPEKMPRPSIMIPFSEITARKSTGTSIGEPVTGSSKYISLTTRR